MESLPIVEGVRIDVDALLALAHRCDPMTCRDVGHCCKSFEVEVTSEEGDRAVGTMGDAAKYVPSLVEDGEYVDPIDETDTGDCLAAHEDGCCVFAFYTEENAVRCSLHAVALDHGVAPEAVKPRPCSLWPLVYEDQRKPPVLTTHDDAPRFPCNTNNARRRLDPGVQEIIHGVFGSEFLDALNSYLDDR